MKYFSVITTISAVISLPLVSANPRTSTVQQRCEAVRTEEECVPMSDCGWLAGRCRFKINETCGFLGSKDSCDEQSNCVWRPDVPDDVRPNAKGNCYPDEESETEELAGECASTGSELNKSEQEFTCNNVKGCNWIGDACAVALTRLQCGDFEDKNSCIEAGCISKTRNKKRLCLGRWETKFLSSLKKMSKNAAKQAIKDEFGAGTYKVTVLRRRRKPAKKINRNRIRLFVDKDDIVSRRPVFG